MSFSHSSLDITGTILLSALPVTPSVFNVQLLIDDEANGTGLAGDRYREYTSTTQLKTDFDASLLSSGAYAAGLLAFQNGVGKLLIGRRDSVGLETYSDALALIEAITQGFYFVHIDSRVSADIAAFATTIEAFARPLLFGWQSADAGWLTASVPAAFAVTATQERNYGVFHTTDTQGLDVAWTSARISGPSPDEQSVPFNGTVAGIADYSPEITESEGNLARLNNINVYGRFEDKNNWVAAKNGAGSTLFGRSIFVMITADLWKRRTEEDFANIIIDFSNRKKKLPLNVAGQNVIVSAMEERISLLMDAEHFDPEQPTTVLASDITAADIAAHQMRFKAEAYALGNASKLTFTLALDGAV